MQANYSNLSDDELAVSAQKGNESAFNVLASRYLNKAYRRSTSPVLDADDFAQESMFGILNAVRTFNAEKGVPFQAYASVCMRNSMNSAVNVFSKDLPADADLDTAVADGGKDPLAKVIDSEYLSEVLGLCETTLSEFEKTVVFCVAGGMSYKEISEKSGVDIKAVDNAVQRARKKLKKAIG